MESEVETMKNKGVTVDRVERLQAVHHLNDDWDKTFKKHARLITCSSDWRVNCENKATKGSKEL